MQKENKMKFTNQVYDDAFDALYKDLLNKKKTKYYTKPDIEGLLKTMYQTLGSSQSGKSEIQHAKLSAAIAAYEMILFEWKE